MRLRVVCWDNLAHDIKVVPVSIEDDVWITLCVTILPGVTIGPSAAVASDAAVTNDFLRMAIGMGAPARVTGQRQSPSRCRLAVDFPLLMTVKACLH